MTTPELPVDGGGVAFVYLAATNRFLQPVLHTLAARNISALAYIAGDAAPGAARPVRAPSIHVLSELVDLKQVADRCRLAITHGGALSASLLLRHGARLVICPQDLEKALLATRLRARGLASSLNWFAPDVEDIGTAIDGVLDSNEIPHGLEAFVASHARRTSGGIASSIAARCEDLWFRGNS